MIFGIGVDVLSADRMRQTFERFGERIVERLLMPVEREQLKRTARVERFLAMRFAAKEAIVKAMGTGFSHGIWIRDVGIVQNAWGKPEVVYSERGEKVRRKLGIGEGHVTLTDEAGLVVAVAVLLNALPVRRKAKSRTVPKAKAKAKANSKAKSKPKARAKLARNSARRAR
jgi:holo-[acyl-carrier protein] synthase